MNLLMVIIMVLFMVGLRFAEPGVFHKDYCSLESTGAIKGIFVMIIFLCHSMDYFPLGEQDLLLKRFSEYMKQLIVVPMLFYSGFGITESIRSKGLSYVKTIPVKRILRTVMFADFAVLVFALLYLLEGRAVGWKHLLSSLVFWDHIENNTWYFFVIVFLYLFTYIAFRIFHRNHYLAATVMTVLSTGFFFFLIATRDIFWYNTFYVFHFGMWYSLLRKWIEPIVMRNTLWYSLSMAVVLLGYSVVRTFGSFYFFIVCSCLFMTLIVGISMKIRFGNSLLRFLGNNIQGVYLFHRLPMRILSRTSLDTVTKFILSFLLTAACCYVFNDVTGFLDRKIFLRKRSDAMQLKG